MLILLSAANLSIIWTILYALTCFIYLLKSSKITLRKEILVIYVLFFCSMVGTMLTSVYSLELYKYPIIAAYAAIGIFYVSYFSNAKKIKHIRNFTYFSFIVIVIQHLSYLVLKFYPDLHFVLTLGKFYSRFEGGIMREYFIRPTGLQIEPSNFASIVLFVAGVSYVFQSYKYFYMLCTVAILTLSSSGILFGLLMVLISIVKSKHVLRILGAMSLGLMIYLWPAIQSAIYSVNFGYDAIGYRIKFFNLLPNLTVYEWFFGIGPLIFSDPIEIANVTYISSNFRDPGAWISLFLSYGLAGVLGLLYLVFKAAKRDPDPQAFMILLLPFCLKLDYMHPFFWIYLTTIVGHRKAVK